MNISTALRDLGCGEMAEAARQFLDEHGYLILADVIDRKWLQQLGDRFEELCDAEGQSAGNEVHQEAGTRRLADLVNKGGMFRRVYESARVGSGSPCDPA